MTNAKSFFSTAHDQTIVAAIRNAEKRTAGEIRVHLEDHCKADPVERAWEMFAELHMHETNDRNSVLIYLAVQDKLFAVVGDEGITNKVGDDFWDHIKEDMQTAFRSGDFVGGLCAAITETGERLAEYFPHSGEDDVNELPDELSIGGR